MFSIILISFFSLVALLALHEFSHFWVAKKFKIQVDEFGIGYPPRLWGKKIGETLYTLNLLPFGAFVRIPEDKLKERPIIERFLVFIMGSINNIILLFLKTFNLFLRHLCSTFSI